jgi:hypothetical protein
MDCEEIFLSSGKTGFQAKNAECLGNDKGRGFNDERMSKADNPRMAVGGALDSISWQKHLVSGFTAKNCKTSKGGTRDLDRGNSGLSFYFTPQNE